MKPHDCDTEQCRHLESAPNSPLRPRDETNVLTMLPGLKERVDQIPEVKNTVVRLAGNGRIVPPDSDYFAPFGDEAKQAQWRRDFPSPHTAHPVLTLAMLATGPLPEFVGDAHRVRFAQGIQKLLDNTLVIAQLSPPLGIPFNGVDANDYLVTPDGKRVVDVDLRYLNSPRPEPKAPITFRDTLIWHFFSNKTRAEINEFFGFEAVIDEGCMPQEWPPA